MGQPLRRWDPAVLKVGGGWILACLAAESKDYAWYLANNRIELWQGETLTGLELAKTISSAPGRAFNGPFLTQDEDGPHLFTGYNLQWAAPNHSPCPDQRLLHRHGGELRELPILPPEETTEVGYYSLRDPYVVRIAGVWHLYAAVGGCRWGTLPDIALWKSHKPRLAEAAWQFTGLLMAPMTRALFGQMERPQVFERNGIWHLIFSVYPAFTNLGSANYDTFVCEGPGPGGPFTFTGKTVNLDMYGPMVHENAVAGCYWTNEADHIGDVKIVPLQDPLSVFALTPEETEAMRAQQQLRSQ